MSSELYLSPECSREHPKHVDLVSCSAPDRCNCTCHHPSRLHVDLDETPIQIIDRVVSCKSHTSDNCDMTLIARPKDKRWWMGLRRIGCVM